MTSDPDNDKYAAGRSAVTAARIKWRTRQVLAAATTLMQDTGFHAMSIQALAQEADVSVGLIYQYFGNKETCSKPCSSTSSTLTAGRSGSDRRGRRGPGGAAGRRLRGLLPRGSTTTIRPPRWPTGVPNTHPRRARAGQGPRAATVQPLHDVITEGQVRGVFLPVDAGLITVDLMMLAHSWALKHWHLAGTYTLEQYIDSQLAHGAALAAGPRDVARLCGSIEEVSGQSAASRPATTTTGGG